LTENKNYLALNLETLFHVKPDLARIISQTNFNIEGIAVAKSDSGWPFLLQTNVNPHRPLENKVDPRLEAKNAIASLNEKIRLVILKGCGLGYLLKPAQARKNIERIVCVEPTLAIFALMLSLFDMRRVILDKRVEFYLGTDAAKAVSALKSNYDFNTDKSASLVVLPPYSVIRHPTFGIDLEFERQFEEEWSILKITSERNRVTLSTFTDLWRKNIIANIPAMLDSAPVSSLFGKGRGTVGILVGAGPSLDKNVDKLIAAQESTYIVAVDSAYRTLLAYGIVPDIVIAVDATAENVKDFDGIRKIPDEVSLVMVPVVDPRIPKMFKSRFTASYGHPIQKWLEKRLKIEFGSLLISGSVSTIGFDLLRKMQVDKIILVGMDMAFGNNTHTKGFLRADTVSRFSTLERIESSREKGETLRVLGWGGGEAETNIIMSRWLEWFQREIKKSRVNVINATEGGASIFGANEMKLEDAIRDLKKNPKRNLSKIQNIDKRNCDFDVGEEDLEFMLKWESAVKSKEELDGVRHSVIRLL